MNPKSWLKCIRCGSTTDLYRERKFLCACGGLYDVEHDFSRVEIAPDQFRGIFDARCKPAPNLPEHNSGVWRFAELVMPSISLLSDQVISLGEGLIPIWPAGNNLRRWVGGKLELYIIPEGLTPTGSFKDFGGTVAFTVAKKAGIKAVACASTGDTSAMAAAYAAAAGMTCAVVLPEGQVTPVQLAQPIAHGAKVITLPGSFDDCMRVVGELVTAERVFPVNSRNPTRIEGHQATVFLAAQAFDWTLPDAFVVPLGNGSNTSSIGKGIRLLRQLGLARGYNGGETKIIAAQSEAANPVACSWERANKMRGGHVTEDVWMRAYMVQTELGETTATAARIGNPVSIEKVMREIVDSDGAVLTSSEDSLNEAVMVAGSDGHFVCPQTGTALTGLRQAVGRGLVREGARVFVVSTATGLKFPNVPTMFSGQKILKAKTCETKEVADLIGV